MNCPHCGKPIYETDLEVKFSELDIRRFWHSVEKTDGCWLWKLNTTPYGRFTFGGNKTMVAHKVAYLISKGPVPPGAKVCHSCDTPACVRPDHLWLGTNGDNIRDAVKKGRWKPMSGERNPTSKMNDSKVTQIRESLARGDSTIQELASRYGVTFQCIYHIARGQTWKHIPGPLVARKHRVELTDPEVLEIKRLCAEGRMNQRQIGNMFSVDQAIVSHIKRGHRRAKVN